MIAQAKSTYSPVRKALEKQTKKNSRSIRKTQSMQKKKKKKKKKKSVKYDVFAEKENIPFDKKKVYRLISKKKYSISLL